MGTSVEKAKKSGISNFNYVARLLNCVSSTLRKARSDWSTNDYAAFSLILQLHSFYTYEDSLRQTCHRELLYALCILEERLIYAEIALRFYISEKTVMRMKKKIISDASKLLSAWEGLISVSEIKCMPEEDFTQLILKLLNTNGFLFL